jgi:hypothetical protein
MATQILSPGLKRGPLGRAGAHPSWAPSSWMPPAHVTLIALAAGLALCLATGRTVFWMGGNWGYYTVVEYGWPWSFCTVAGNVSVHFNGWGSEPIYVTTPNMDVGVYWWDDTFAHANGSAFCLGLFLADAFVWVGLAALASAMARAPRIAWRLLARLLSANQHAAQLGRVDVA